MGNLTKLLLELANKEDLEDLERIDRERIVYAQLKRKADDKFTKISSGSARQVYEYKDNMVIKVAYNEKGITQNELECNIGRDTYAQIMVAKVFYCAENYSFIISEKAEKLIKSKFRDITGIDWDDFTDFVFAFGMYHKGSKRYIETIDPDLNTNNYEFLYDFEQFVLNYDMIGGINDLDRISSYGVVTRDNEEHIVIIDYGLNQMIFDEYYK